MQQTAPKHNVLEHKAVGSPSVLPVAISRVAAVRCQPESIQRPTQPEVQNDLSPHVPSLAWAGHSTLCFPLCPSLSAGGELGLPHSTEMSGRSDSLHGGWLPPAFMFRETRADTATLLVVWP